jgi:hypothetical protein
VALVSVYVVVLVQFEIGYVELVPNVPPEVVLRKIVQLEGSVPAGAVHESDTALFDPLITTLTSFDPAESEPSDAQVD